MMGGSLGLAILAAAAAFHTGALLQSGVAENAAILAGYHVAFLVGAIFAALAAVVTFLFIRVRAEPPTQVPMH